MENAIGPGFHFGPIEHSQTCQIYTFTLALSKITRESETINVVTIGQSKNISAIKSSQLPVMDFMNIIINEICKCKNESVIIVHAINH